MSTTRGRGTWRGMPGGSGRDGHGGEPSDAELLNAHRAGDPQAFGTLFTRHRDRLWAVALASTGHPEDAADALQEAMVSAFTRAEGYRGEAAVTTWLHRIVVNACLDRLRRNKVRRAQALPDDLEERARRGDLVASAVVDADPEAAAVAEERRRDLWDALAQLSPEQRTALVLVDMEGYPIDEVATMLQCPSGTIKSRCARGRSRLASLLEIAPTGTSAPGTTAPGDASHRGPEPDLEGGTLR